MSTLTKVNFNNNQRVDTSDWNRAFAFIGKDFLELLKGMVSDQPTILYGFNILNPELAIGNAREITVDIANSALLNPTSLGVRAGFYVAESGEAPQTITLVPGVVNFVELEYEQVLEEKGVRAFWNPTANGGVGEEFSERVDTVQKLKVKVTSNIQGFTDGNVPIATITMSGGSTPTISKIKDSRPLMFNDDGLYQLPDPQTSINEADLTTPGDPFIGGAKGIKNLREWMILVMRALTSLKDGAPWYGDENNIVTDVSLENLWFDSLGSKITGVGEWKHTNDNAGNSTVEWTSDIKIRCITGELYFLVPASSFSPVLDGEVIYIELVRNVPFAADAAIEWNVNYANGSEGSFSGLGTGLNRPWVKAQGDGFSKYVRVAQYWDAVNGGGAPTTPDLALSITYEDGDATPTTYTGTIGSGKGVYSTLSYTATKADRASVPDSANVYWLACRDDRGSSPTVYLRGWEGQLERGDIKEISDSDDDLDQILRPVINPAGADGSIFIYPSQTISSGMRRYSYLNSQTEASSIFPPNGMAYDGGTNNDRLTKVEFTTNTDDVDITITYPTGAPVVIPGAASGTALENLVMAGNAGKVVPVLVFIDPSTDTLDVAIGSLYANLTTAKLDANLPIISPNTGFPIAIAMVQVNSAETDIEGISSTRLLDRRPYGGGGGSGGGGAASAGIISGRILPGEFALDGSGIMVATHNFGVTLPDTLYEVTLAVNSSDSTVTYGPSITGKAVDTITISLTSGVTTNLNYIEFHIVHTGISSATISPPTLTPGPGIEIASYTVSTIESATLKVGLEFEGRHGDASSSKDAFAKFINLGGIINGYTLSSADLSLDSFIPSAGKFGNYALAVGAHGPQFDASSNTNINSNTATFSHTCTSNANRLLLVSVSLNDDTQTVSSVTYNGVALTLLSSQTRTSDSITEVWYLMSPDSGTHDVVVNLSGSQRAVIGATSFYNVNTVHTLEDPIGNHGTQTASISDVSVYDNSILFAASSWSDDSAGGTGGPIGTITYSAGGTELYNVKRTDAGTDYVLGAAAYESASNRGTNISFTWDSSDGSGAGVRDSYSYVGILINGFNNPIVAFPGNNGNNYKGSFTGWGKNLGSNDYIAFNPLLGIEIYKTASSKAEMKLTEKTAAAASTKQTQTITSTSNFATSASFSNLITQWSLNKTGTSEIHLFLNGIEEASSTSGTFNINAGDGGVWFFGAKRNDPSWTRNWAAFDIPSVEDGVTWSSSGGATATISDGVMNLITSGDSRTFSASVGINNIATNGFTIEWKLRINNIESRTSLTNQLLGVRFSDVTSDYNMGIYFGTGCITIVDDRSGTGVVLADIYTDTTEYHTYRATRIGTVVKFYIDGVLIYSQTIAAAVTASSNNVSFGVFNNATSDSDWEYLRYYSDAGTAVYPPVTYNTSAGYIDSIGVIDGNINANSINLLQNYPVTQVFNKIPWYGPYLAPEVQYNKTNAHYSLSFTSQNSASWEVDHKDYSDYIIYLAGDGISKFEFDGCVSLRKSVIGLDTIWPTSIWGSLITINNDAKLPATDNGSDAYIQNVIYNSPMTIGTDTTDPRNNIIAPWLCSREGILPVGLHTIRMRVYFAERTSSASFVSATRSIDFEPTGAYLRAHMKKTKRL